MDGPIRRQPVVSPRGPIGPQPTGDAVINLDPESDLVSPDISQPIALPAAEEPRFVYRKPKKVHGGFFKSAKWIAISALIAIVAVGGWFGYRGLVAAHNIFARSNGGAPGLAGVLDVTKLKGEGDGRVNILVLGIGGQGHEAPDLTDTMMVISIDPKTKDAAILSIPRDLYVKIPATDKTRVQYAKINAANVYGGPELSARVVSNVIGVPIHYYVVLDFSGFRQAVDAVGGVDINVPKAIYDTQYPCDNERGGYCPFKIAAGLQHMDGTVALRYSRSRKSTSDFDRAARQQMVIAALRVKALQLSTLTNPVKLTGLIDALGSHIKTDIQPAEVAKIAALVKEIDPAKTPTKVLDTDSKDPLLVGGINIIDGAGYIEVPKIGNFDYTDIQDLVKNIFTDHYLVDENALLEVQNGSGIPGLASSVVKSLQSAHYNVGDPLNAVDHYATTVLYDYTGGKKPYTINYLEQRFKVKAQRMTAPTPTVDASGKPAAVPQIRIILGSDYKTGTTAH
jgi:LCP family protein required for cell wall assembly